tara:strand:+ start:79 stop:711 length:633 start_codon:yes stop_codon:yes gene_type:complete
MAYFLGRDVAIAITTEDADYGVDVTTAGVKGTFAAAAGTTDLVFAGPLAQQNTGTDSVFDNQDVTADYSNEIGDLTGCDLGIGVTDEDITYLGARSVLKAEIKKETTVTLTRKKSNICWDTIFNDGGRWGVTDTTFYTGLEDPAVSTFGYRVYIKLKNTAEVFMVRNACIQGHSITLNADGTTEETLELMSYVDPLIGTTDSVAVTTTGL